MSVAVDRVARKYLNVVAGNAVNVDIPCFSENDVVVLYGRVGNVALLDADYTVALDVEGGYDDFTVTPTASLITKINALIAADPDEANQIVVRRVLDVLTDITPETAYFRKTLATEFDKTAMRFQQLVEVDSRSIKISATETQEGGAYNLELPDAAARANKAMVFDVNGNVAVSVDDYNDQIADVTAQASAAAASAATASAQATIATSQAAAAATSRAAADADAAATAADRAAVAADKVTVAADKAIVAADKALVAADKAATAASALAASGSETNALAYRNAAQAAQAAAEVARDAALSAYDSFDDRYLGAKAAAPTLDNDGNALVGGALYFDTVAGAMQLWTGSAWVAAYVSGSGYLAATNNLSDVANPSTARGNLGAAAASHGHASADISDFTEAAQDVVGAMVAAAGGSYNDGAGTIAFPAGGGAVEYVTSIATTAGIEATFTGMVAGEDYIFQFDHVHWTTNDALMCQVGTGATPTWQTTDKYFVAFTELTDNNPIANKQYTDAAWATLTYAATSGTYGGISGTIEVFGPSSGYAEIKNDLVFAEATSRHSYRTTGVGSWLGASTPITAIRFRSVNLQTYGGGAIHVYKRVKA